MKRAILTHLVSLAAMLTGITVSAAWLDALPWPVVVVAVLGMVVAYYFAKWLTGGDWVLDPQDLERIDSADWIRKIPMLRTILLVTLRSDRFRRIIRNAIDLIEGGPGEPGRDPGSALREAQRLEWARDARAARSPWWAAVVAVVVALTCGGCAADNNIAAAVAALLVAAAIVNAAVAWRSTAVLGTHRRGARALLVAPALVAASLLAAACSSAPVVVQDPGIRAAVTAPGLDVTVSCGERYGDRPCEASADVAVAVVVEAGLTPCVSVPAAPGYCAPVPLDVRTEVRAGDDGVEARACVESPILLMGPMCGEWGR